MTEVLVTKNISRKIKKLDKSGEKDLLKKIVLAVENITSEGGRKNHKKVLHTDNIYVIRLGMLNRLFYSIEKDKNGQEIILLLDIFNRAEYSANSLDFAELLERKKERPE
ncbi:hypothetical protein [Bacillus toyonensis]|uniref:hypothetical protein n=1 Tax=Bacillus toyonensis TaxID=155322 RepID=UPI001C0D91F2|nr:hypothetical protein [Bacillus toyonensis]MBU4639421.1 hypothetical protein [Bacillus toyonensis]